MGRGHRTIPHTADIALEAWGDDREECLAEAVRALVGGFADLGGATPDGEVEFEPGREDGPAPLIALLEEVIYRVEVDGVLVVDVRPGPAGVLLLATVPVEGVEQVGAMPKAVTTHGMRFGPENGQWRAYAVVDV
ncbi:archease [Nonomuraea candida]|uniref:archease n=1 Tax=Nonomuraea candida TaxID=359159 RepID=UPI0005B82EE4|nr:archease [Nonomuraea candida]